VIIDCRDRTWQWVEIEGPIFDLFRKYLKNLIELLKNFILSQTLSPLENGHRILKTKFANGKIVIIIFSWHFLISLSNPA